MNRMNHHHEHYQHDDREQPGVPFGAERPGRGRGPRRGGPHGPHGRGRRGPDFTEAFLGPIEGPGFRRRRGPGRGQRGDVRNAVLALLAERPMNGYQVITAIAEKTDGVWRPSAGSIYPALGLLQDEGLIHPAELEGKKVFELTADGRNYVEANADALTDPWAKVAGPHQDYLNVRKEVGSLALALQQVVMAGNTEQVKAARGVLDEARRSIYRILAGDAPE